MEAKVVKELKILDFDLETVAAGFADPEFVPQKITCCAWSWVGSKKVVAEVCGTEGLFGKPELRAKMLEPLVASINEADILTGHNIIRFDLPVLQAELLRLGLSPLGAQKVQDTIRIVKTKGFKKGQDNIGALLDSKEQKLHLSWQNWQDGYDEEGWVTIKKRCASDVLMHKEIREVMIKNEWLKPITTWRPRS